MYVHFASTLLHAVWRIVMSNVIYLSLLYSNTCSANVLESTWRISALRSAKTVRLKVLKNSATIFGQRKVDVPLFVVWTLLFFKDQSLTVCSSIESASIRSFMISHPRPRTTSMMCSIQTINWELLTIRGEWCTYEFVSNKTLMRWFIYFSQFNSYKWIDFELDVFDKRFIIIQQEKVIACNTSAETNKTLSTHLQISLEDKTQMKCSVSIHLIEHQNI